MNKLLYVLILSISFGLFSCETDIDVNAEYKDITAVYGLINPSESNHYIKINKAFLGEGSALDLAANADNFNYAAGELIVTVEAYDGNNSLKNTYSTTRTVNEIIKDQGIFDNSSNVLYKFIEPNINRDYKYLVKIVNTETDKEVTAETQIVGSFAISSSSTDPKFQFWNGTAGSGNYLNKRVEVVVGRNIGRVATSLIFHYTQFYTISSGKDSTVHFIEMPLGDEQTLTPLGNEELSWVLLGETFFDNIRASVSSGSTISDFSHRRMDNISLDFAVGGTELNTFIEVSAPSSSVNQDKPSYTNINNGLGIFSSRELIPWVSTLDPIASNQINIQNSTIAKLQSLNLGFCFGDVNIGFPAAPCQQL
ncbi:hypothetical protein N9242_04830 [Vicingaceae bacterium]|nr:hypothetical protein [Vicingaceae bacterium]